MEIALDRARDYLRGFCTNLGGKCTGDFDGGVTVVGRSGWIHILCMNQGRVWALMTDGLQDRKYEDKSLDESGMNQEESRIHPRFWPERMKGYGCHLLKLKNW